MQSCYVKFRMFITIFTYELLCCSNQRCTCADTQPGGRSDCMCVRVYRWPCLYVCCSQNSALVHTHNQVASRIACVSKYTAGCCRFMHMQLLYGSQLPTEQQPPTAPQPTLVNRPVMSPVAVLWPHLRGRKLLISAGKQDAGMHIALSCMHHISCICRLPAGKLANRQASSTYLVCARRAGLWASPNCQGDSCPLGPPV